MAGMWKDYDFVPKPKEGDEGYKVIRSKAEKTAENERRKSVRKARGADEMDSAGCVNLARPNAAKRGGDAASSGSAAKKATSVTPSVMGGAPAAPAALTDGCYPG